MDFSAPSPASSSEDSRASYSPRLMSSDLGLDPDDPLNLLLHNTSQSHTTNFSMEDSSQEGESPPDWSQVSMLWPDNDPAAQTKPYSDMIDFSELASLSMDVDFSNAIAIEPSALHFNPMKYNNINGSYAYSSHTPSYADDLLAAHFPFTFQPHSPSEDTSSHQSGRRLSITSSSSSAASLSPAPESVPSPVIAKHIEYPPTTASDAASKLAERVRQSSGVMLALPMNAQLQAHEDHQAAQTAQPTTMPKLPIPRLPRPVSYSIKSTSTVSSAASTPPPSTPPPPSSAAPTTRPKTSHTTIERRYRTNLNARIQSLRMAVPALRVVEDREGGKKRAPNKVLVSADLGLHATASGVDVVDERGFVDGVKVARKCSKANVLGKAVEYIRVLKKREIRLKAEQAGLRALITGLVGGPALLREWEREWREMFGGEERDEVEGEMEDDDDEDDEEEDEEEGGRKRKRGKTTVAAAVAASVPAAKVERKMPVQGTEGVAPEKRKRGRPRKVVGGPFVPHPVQEPKMEPEYAQGQGQGPQQYLLATFALFSFFNSPLTSSSPAPSHHAHAHTGTVLNGSASVPMVEGSGAWGLTEYMQVFHLLVSLVVLLSFVSSWVGFGFSLGKARRGGGSFLAFGGHKEKEKDRADWVRLGEECVLSSPVSKNQNVPLLTRLQIYHRISSAPGIGARELATAALVLYGVGAGLGSLARTRARAMWATAKTRAGRGSTAYERLVLEEMTVDKAVVCLRDDGGEEEEDGEGRAPVRVLAGALVRERVRGHLGVLFVGCVRGVEEKEAVEREDAARERTVEAARELGGRVGELGRRLERVWKGRGGGEDVVGQEEVEDEEVEALLRSVVLYRRMFAADGGGKGRGASGLISPPPSPGRKETGDAGMLRRALGSRVFEETLVLEDARDRAVDMVVELERRSVGLE